MYCTHRNGEGDVCQKRMGVMEEEEEVEEEEEE